MGFQYRWIISLSMALGLFLSGVYLGYQYAAGQQAQALQEAQGQALETARQQAELDRQAAVARARREAVAAERARAARTKGVRDATLKARADCSRDTESLGLLVDALQTANGAPAGPGGVPVALPDRTPAGERDGSGDPALGVRPD